MQLNPFATFDCLFLARYLQRKLGGFSEAELHLLAYMACLLSLYREEPLTDWGYSFICTKFGAPYSREIAITIEELERRILFLRTKDKFQISNTAEQRLDDLIGLCLYQQRIDCLIAASSSTAAFSIGIVREALNSEPELHRAKKLPANRELFEEPGLRLIYDQFQLLRQALGCQSKDLRVPAVAWLTALFKFGEQEEIAG